MAYLEVCHLTKQLQENIVLNHIDLAIEKGEAVGFVGKNGSGKTMLFRAVCGLLHPTSGEVRFCGKTIGKDLQFLPGVGLLIENVGLWDHLTAYENLKLLNNLNQTKATPQQIKALIRKFGLDPDSPKPFRKFSLGMKQRLCLAQAFLNNPEIFILDEPTNALDESGVAMMEQYLLEEKQNGHTILLASHDAQSISNVCDRVYYMRAGELSAVPFN